MSDADGLEEERRLMYVAITRARKRLYLSFSQTRLLHGQTRYNVKSRFLDELPEGALKWLTPRNAGFGHVYECVIPRNTRVAEAPSHGKPILLYDYDCAGSQAYIRLASEMIERERQTKAA